MFSDLYFNTRNQPIYNTFTDWRGGHLDSNWLSFHHPSHSKWEGGGEWINSHSRQVLNSYRNFTKKQNRFSFLRFNIQILPLPPPPPQDLLCPCYLPAHKDRGTRLPQRMRTRILTPTPPRLPYFLVSRLLASLQPTVPSYMDAEKGERGGVRKGVSCMGTF